MKFLKNKFFIACVSISLALIIFTSVLSAMGLQNYLADGVNTLLYPLRWCGYRIRDGFIGYTEYFRDMDDLLSENESLRQEIDSYKSELNDSQAVREENDRLREYLELKRIYSDLTLCDALIISRGSESYMTVMTLNRGSGDGIEKGMPVIVSSGLVGCVFEVGYNWCKVRTVIEDTSGVGAYIYRSGDIGIVEGDVMNKDTNYCHMNYLRENCDVTVGDMVYTSGLGSVYPRGIPIGRVVEVRENAYDRTVSAKIEVFADLSSLTYVMIVTDHDINTDPIGTGSAENAAEDKDA